VVGTLLQLLRGKRRSRRSRRRRSPLGSLLRWFTPGLTLTGVIAVILAVLTGHIHLPSLDNYRGDQPPVVDDPIAAQFDPSGSAVGSAFPGAGATPSSGAAGQTPAFSSEPSASGSRAETSSRFGGPTPGGNPDPPIQSVALSTAGRTPPTKSLQAIRVATFNIRVFGTSKAGKPDVIDALAKTVLQFDIVAIQEIRGDPSIPINALLSRVYELGGRYQATVSEPIGRTSQTECYGFIWDQRRIDLVPGSDYKIDDPMDRMHREPMVATFQTRVASTDSLRPFRFTMINVHTDPDEVFGDTPDNELNVLDDVFVRVRDWQYRQDGEDDYLLLGDLNVDTEGLAELGRIRNIVSLAGDEPTNTKRTKTYDHILIDRAVTVEATGRAGVLDLGRWLKLDEAAVSDISDHLPVWAEFTVYESPRYSMSARPSTTAR